MPTTVLDNLESNQRPSSMAEAFSYMRRGDFRLKLPSEICQGDKEVIENCIRQYMSIGVFLEFKYLELKTSAHQRAMRYRRFKQTFEHMADTGFNLLRLCEVCTLDEIKRRHPELCASYENIYDFWIGIVTAHTQAEIEDVLSHSEKNDEAKRVQCDRAAAFVRGLRNENVLDSPEIGIGEGSKTMALLRTAFALKKSNPTPSLRNAIESYISCLSRGITKQRNDHGKIPVVRNGKLFVRGVGDHLYKPKRITQMPPLPKNFWKRHSTKLVASVNNFVASSKHSCDSSTEEYKR